MLQGGEIIIILLLALIVLGPTRLPDVARKLGKWTAELRSAAREITRGLEAEVSDIKSVKDELENLRREVRASDPRRFEWQGPKPVSGPTPEDAMADLERIEESEGDDEAGE
jgi:Tat protein translocase TatB subunit